MLRPFISQLYINDFSVNLEGENDVFQFADDNRFIYKLELNQKIPQQIIKNVRTNGQLSDRESTHFNAEKTEMLFFTNQYKSDSEFSFKDKIIKTANACPYLGVQNDSNLTSKNHLNSVLIKMAKAIRSLYRVRNQIPLKVRIDVFKSVVLSHLSFSGVFLQKFTAKNINRINVQINWGIKICYFWQKFDHSFDLLIKGRILSAELFISKISLKSYKQI